MLLDIALYCLCATVPVFAASTFFMRVLSGWLRAGYMFGDLILTIVPTFLIFAVDVRLCWHFFPDAERSHTLLLAIAAMVCGAVFGYSVSAVQDKSDK